MTRNSICHAPYQGNHHFFFSSLLFFFVFFFLILSSFAQIFKYFAPFCPFLPFFRRIEHIPLLFRIDGGDVSYNFHLWCTCVKRSPSIFFFSFFRNFDFPCWGKRAKNEPKWQKKSVCHAPYLRKHTFYDHDCWYSCVKQWYFRVLFSFFQNFDFLGCEGANGKNGPNWQKVLPVSLCVAGTIHIRLWFLIHMQGFPLWVCTLALLPSCDYFCYFCPPPPPPPTSPPSAFPSKQILPAWGTPH